MSIALGQVVHSKVGRDAGREFIILDIINESYVLIADGDLRRMEKPKRKKLKHLEVTNDIIVTLSEKLNNKLKVTNSVIRKALTALHSEKEDQGG